MLIPPPVFAAAAAAVQGALSRGRRPTVGSGLLAAPFVVTSAALVASSFAKFAEHRTTVDPTRPERASALVQDGVFGYTRNPMYLALTSALVAHAVLRRSVPALAPAAAFAVVIDRIQIPAEEQALRQRFGDDYVAYALRTPRWLPRWVATP